MTLFDSRQLLQPVTKSSKARRAPIAGLGGTPTRKQWESTYKRHLQVTDTVVVVCAVALAQWVRFGSTNKQVASLSVPNLSYHMTSVGLALVWIAFLAIFGTRSPRVIGSDAEEYRRVVAATFRLFGLIAIATVCFRVDLARGYLAIALPAGLAGLLASRWGWRHLVGRRRKKGEFQTSMLVVGGEAAVLELARCLESCPGEGHRVVGVCMPGHRGQPGESVDVDGRKIPIFGDEHSVIDAVTFSSADTVAVTATEQLGHRGIRKLVWDLEPYDVDLVVAPGVVDVAGPRLAMRPVANLPLIHVEKPQYRGATRFAKGAFDRIGALLLLVFVSPILVSVALTIKCADRGPTFYRQTRVGKNGRTFRIWKFRSMVVDADGVLQLVREQAGQADTTFFKSTDDPRVTRIGKFIRRTSIDELPQLLNVIAGDMSLVGPRPLVVGEGADVEDFLERRILVRPGITGLWQVSGRSELSEEERVRLDLLYVENWSMVQDLEIIWRTLSVVRKGEGAY